MERRRGDRCRCLTSRRRQRGQRRHRAPSRCGRSSTRSASRAARRRRRRTSRTSRRPSRCCRRCCGPRKQRRLQDRPYPPSRCRRWRRPRLMFRRARPRATRLCSSRRCTRRRRGLGGAWARMQRAAELLLLLLPRQRRLRKASRARTRTFCCRPSQRRAASEPVYKLKDYSSSPSLGGASAVGMPTLSTSASTRCCACASASVVLRSHRPQAGQKRQRVRDLQTHLGMASASAAACFSSLALISLSPTTDIPAS